MRCAFVTAAIVLCAVRCFGQVVGGEHLQINFTSADDAAQKATWSPADRINLGSKGLGWDRDGTSDEPINGSILTQPQAMGLSWRPTQTVRVRLSVESSTRVATGPDGTQLIRLDGTAYTRYSADAVHWTNWQPIPRVPGALPLNLNDFAGTVGEAQLDRAAYEGLQSEYARLDVPWTSDEEALAKWIVQRRPNFFKDHVPFVGYLQLRFDAKFLGGQRVTSLHADMDYFLSGLSATPKDLTTARNRQGPWRFTIAPTAPATQPLKDPKP